MSPVMSTTTGLTLVNWNPENNVTSNRTTPDGWAAFHLHTMRVLCPEINSSSTPAHKSSKAECLDGYMNGWMVTQIKYSEKELGKYGDEGGQHHLILAHAAVIKVTLVLKGQEWREHGDRRSETTAIVPTEKQVCHACSPELGCEPPAGGESQVLYLHLLVNPPLDEGIIVELWSPSHSHHPLVPTQPEGSKYVPRQELRRLFALQVDAETLGHQ
uniref:Uncharacterized protein n=1 Tax=Timema bartmani TaxID=61472 RepID=A0A7R9EUY5_9NEOP|nr:unnamed protein product [Timema bartmani]